MKKSILFLLGIYFSIAFSQNSFLKINDKSFEINEFEKSQKKSLELLGVKKTVSQFINFELLKQYALKNNAEKDPEFLLPYYESLKTIKDSLYFPLDFLEPKLQKYHKDIQMEKGIQIFITDKKVIAEEVFKKIKSKKTTIDEAIKNQSNDKTFINPQFIAAGYLDETIEKEIFRLKVGEFSTIIPYNGNFIIIFLKTERAFLGDIYLAEIILRKQDSIKANEVYDLLKKGSGFEEMYGQNTIRQTLNNGKIPKINFNIPVDIYNEIKKLNVGEFSKPFIYNNEIHITKLIKIEDYIDYTKSRKRLKDLYLSDFNKIKLDFEYVLPLVKKSGKYYENTEEIEKTILNIKNKEKLNEKAILFSINKENFTNKNIIDTLAVFEKNADKNNPVENLISTYINYTKTNKILNYYDNEYFYIQDRIQSKVDSIKNILLLEYAYNKINLNAAKDEKGISEYIQKNKENYTWNERAKGDLYYCIDKKTALEVQNLIQNKKTSKEILALYKDKKTPKSESYIYHFYGKLQQNAREFPPNANFEKGLRIVKYKNEFVVLNIEKIVPKEVMEYNEIKNEITPIYQDFYLQKLIKNELQTAQISQDESVIKQLEEKYKP